MKHSPLTITMFCSARGMPLPVFEHRFHPTRRWRFDLAWPAQLVAVEINGGAWSGGRHTRGAGYIKDMEKLNAAALLGWRVLQFTPQQILTTAAMEQISQLLNQNTK